MQRKNARMTFRCPGELRKEIEKDAERLQWPMSDILVGVLKNWFFPQPKSNTDEIFQELDEIADRLESKQSEWENRERQTQ